MVQQPSRSVSSRLAATALIAGCLAALVVPSAAQDPGAESPVAAATGCTVDLRSPGAMKDIVSNALMRGLHRPEPAVAAFLLRAETRYSTGQQLLQAAAAEFAVDEAVLAAQVERFRHCNCTHGGADGTAEARRFAADVTVHVVLHELGHALIREFDLPVLGNEETMADAFATHYLTTHMPDRASAVLTARVQSLMIEAREVPRGEWSVSGEHDNDARRAFQIAALAIAADASKYESVAAAVGMSERDIQRSRDYGAEVHRSWRRILAPLWMPAGSASGEARVICDANGGVVEQLCSAGLASELESVIRRFDWHSQVTIRFVEGAGGAGWSRSQRTVTVHGEYIERFVRQGRVAQR